MTLHLLARPVAFEPHKYYHFLPESLTVIHNFGLFWSPTVESCEQRGRSNAALSKAGVKNTLKDPSAE